MEQLTKQLVVRLTEKEYMLLKNEAEQRDRTMGWIVREKLRKTAN